MTLRTPRALGARIAGAAILACGASVQAQSPEPDGISEPRIELAFDGPLTAFVEHVAGALAIEVRTPPELEGRVTVHSRGRAEPARARELLESVARTHGLQIVIRSDESLELVDPTRTWEQRWSRLLAERTVLTLEAQLGHLTHLVPRTAPIESVTLRGARGRVTFRPAREPSPGAVAELLDLFSATERTVGPPDASSGLRRSSPRPPRPPGFSAGWRADPPGSFTVQLARAELEDALGTISAMQGWKVVADPDALQPGVLDYETPGPVSRVEVERFLRAVLGVQGLEVVEGADGVRALVTTGARAYGQERMPPSLRTRLGGTPGGVDLPRGSQDLGGVLRLLGERAGVRLVWRGPCARRLTLIAGRLRHDDLEAPVPALLAAILESHDLVTRVGQGGEVEVLPRGACQPERPPALLATPHPVLERWGVRAGDHIVAIGGVPVREMSREALATRLRPDETQVLSLLDARAFPREVEIPSTVLRTLLGD